MKFTCQKDIILKEISDASDFTSQRNTIVTLGSVFLSLDGNSLTVKTTDQKMGYISEITVDGTENGRTTVVCDKFLDIIKNLPDSEIQFEQKDDKISIKPVGTSIDFKLRTSDADSFPQIEIPQEEQFFRVPQKDMTDMINQVSFAVSDDESKFAMNGALFEKDGNGIVMVGTDGRRLSYINRQIVNEIPDFGSITIPSRFLSIIKKHSVSEGIFQIAVTSQSMYINTGSCIIFSNLIKNEFPAYKRVIPANQTKSCVVSVKALEEAIKRVSLLVENKYKKVVLEFRENKLVISTEETDVGTGREEIDCKYADEPLKCAMNYTYILNPLKVMDGSEAKISFTENGRPFTVTPEPERDYLHVIMPMNLN